VARSSHCHCIACCAHLSEIPRGTFLVVLGPTRFHAHTRTEKLSQISFHHATQAVMTKMINIKTIPCRISDGSCTMSTIGLHRWRWWVASWQWLCHFLEWLSLITVYSLQKAWDITMTEKNDGNQEKKKCLGTAHLTAGALKKAQGQGRSHAGHSCERRRRYRWYRGIESIHDVGMIWKIKTKKLIRRHTVSVGPPWVFSNPDTTVTSKQCGFFLTSSCYELLASLVPSILSCRYVSTLTHCQSIVAKEGILRKRRSKLITLISQ